MSIKVIHGDCLQVMPELAAEGVLVDACVCDPPYHLTSIVKRYGGADAKPNQEGADGRFARATRGFMQKTWDGGDIAAQPETWRLVFDLLKPGAHLVAFGGTRTYHRMACAIEDAGFEIRDALMWHYGSGFPKSHDIGKAIDRAAGAERAVVGVAGRSGSARACMAGDFAGGEYHATSPATAAARQWEGWGTALKPATEIICLARKPLSEKTIAANVQEHGTGAINIDGCRVSLAGKQEHWDRYAPSAKIGFGDSEGQRQGGAYNDKGRWPANVITDGSEEVLAAFPDSVSPKGYVRTTAGENAFTGRVYGTSKPRPEYQDGFGDTGTAARFFASFPMTDEDWQWSDPASFAGKRFHYSSKADASDRLESRHPCVKPVDLMAYLCRLVTPPGGLILDPFAGSGATGMACMREGFRAILIEKEEEYYHDILKRLDHVRGADTPLFSSSASFSPQREMALPLCDTSDIAKAG